MSPGHSNEKAPQLRQPNPDLLAKGIGSFRFGKLLGRGSFGIVLQAKDVNTGKEVAVKIIDRHSQPAWIIQKLVREILVMSAVEGHPNVVSLKRVYTTTHSLMIVMELVKGMDLLDYVNIHGRDGLQPDIVRRIFAQIVEGVKWCHSRGVVHRDLKLDNILISKDGRRVKIIDFGLSKEFEPRKRLNSYCGSVPYFSPEMAMNEPYFGPEIDNWCLGVILFRLSTGQDPFGQFKNDDNIKIAIRDGLFSVPSRIPQELRRTIYTLMDVRRGTRYSLWNLLDNDDWFCGRRNNEAPEYVRPIVSPCWQPEASRRNLGSETTIQIPSAPEAKTAIPHDLFSVYPLPMLLDERGKPSAELRPAPCVRVRTTAQQFHPLIKNFDKATAFLRKDSGRARFTKFFRKLWGCRVKLQYEAQPSCGAAELRELIETALTSDGAACRTKHDGTLVCSIAVPKADFKKPAAYGPLPPCWRRAPTTPHPTVGVSPAQKAEAMQQYASSLRPKHATIKCQLPEMKTAVVNLKVSGGSIKASLRKGSSGVYFSALRDLATNLHDSRSR